jgi:hypothetical protein
VDEQSSLMRPRFGKISHVREKELADPNDVFIHAKNESGAKEKV